MSRPFESWGRLFPPHRDTVELASLPDPASFLGGHLTLPVGQGRSYGDVCLRSDGTLLRTRSRKRILSFDASTGVIRCEAGLTLDELLGAAVPQGWFSPVVPGTRFVTIGGAVANDVHGKNHHTAGSFGSHVKRLQLLRSDGSRIQCGPDEEPEWFAVTVGGLGLSGLIEWVELQLIPIVSRQIDSASRPIHRLEDFFAVRAEADGEFDYTVAWIDCTAKGKRLGRGWHFGGDHRAVPERLTARTPREISIPVAPPFSLINRLTVPAFNAAYYRIPRRARASVDYEPFFFPLDRVRHWNRLYGRGGLYQFQCVVPSENGAEAIRDLLGAIRAAGEGSFLAVLKVFGDRPSPGILSFPRPGPTLAIDFPNRGQATLRLMHTLEAITVEAGGALYPAKDVCMSPETFRRGFPAWERIEARRDPAILSDFWRRVALD